MLISHNNATPRRRVRIHDAIRSLCTPDILSISFQIYSFFAVVITSTQLDFHATGDHSARRALLRSGNWCWVKTIRFSFISERRSSGFCSQTTPCLRSVHRNTVRVEQVWLILLPVKGNYNATGSCNHVLLILGEQFGNEAHIGMSDCQGCTNFCIQCSACRILNRSHIYM